MDELEDLHTDQINKCFYCYGSCYVMFDFLMFFYKQLCKKGKRKVQGVPQSLIPALPRPQEEEENDKSKQAQTEQTYEKH